MDNKLVDELPEAWGDKAETVEHHKDIDVNLLAVSDKYFKILIEFALQELRSILDNQQAVCKRIPTAGLGAYLPEIIVDVV